MKYASNQFPKPIKQIVQELTINQKACFVLSSMEKNMPNLYKYLTKK